MKQKFRSSVLVMFAVLASAPAIAATGDYTFKNIIDDSDGSLVFFEQPLMADNGMVGFGVTRDFVGTGIFVSDGDSITTIVDSGDPSSPYGFFGNVGRPSINANGTVAFIAARDDIDGPGNIVGVGIFVGNGGPIATVADNNDGGTFRSFDDGVAIDDHGTVAFGGFLNSGESGIFTGDGSGAPTPVISNVLGGITINNNGEIAYNPRNGVFRITEGTITTIADTSDGFREAAWSAPKLNNNGAVAFLAGFPSGGGGIFVGDGGPLTTIADNNGPLMIELGSIASINDNGTVVFTDQYGRGIFTGGDPIADKVIGAGDLLFGSTVDDDFAGNVGITRWSLNNAGQIAFTYRLDNGVSGIAVATLIPEPGSMVILGVGGLGMTQIILRRRLTA